MALLSLYIESGSLYRISANLRDAFPCGPPFLLPQVMLQVLVFATLVVLGCTALMTPFLLHLLRLVDSGWTVGGPCVVAMPGMEQKHTIVGRRGGLLSMVSWRPYITMKVIVM